MYPFSPFSPFLFHSTPLDLSPGKRHKKREEKVREMDDERKADINITFTECPLTLALISLEKVKARFCILVDSVVSLYSPPVAPCLKKKLDFYALTPISPFVVYAHSVLAFTNHPSFPSPPIYCDLAPPNDEAYTCLQD